MTDTTAIGGGFQNVSAAGTAGGAIGQQAGTWGGRALGGALGELFGPEAVIPGAILGGRLGGYLGQLGGTALGEWWSSHMNNANDKADDSKAAPTDQTDVCTTCTPPKPPNNRHDPCKVKSNNPTKENNSMVDPDVKDQVNQEVQDIRDGKIPKQGETWTTNGRTYGSHNGALFPQSGPGIVELPNRLQHQLLGQLNSNSYENAMKFADALRAKGLMSDAEFQQVMDLWNKCPKNLS